MVPVFCMLSSLGLYTGHCECCIVENLILLCLLRSVDIFGCRLNSVLSLV